MYAGLCDDRKVQIFSGLRRRGVVFLQRSVRERGLQAACLGGGCHAMEGELCDGREEVLFAEFLKGSWTMSELCRSLWRASPPAEIALRPQCRIEAPSERLRRSYIGSIHSVQPFAAAP
jgi:hypothetical protein